MFVAGIDAHATYSVIAIVSNTGQLVEEPVRINNADEDRLHELFEPYRPLSSKVTPPAILGTTKHQTPARIARASPHTRWRFSRLCK